MFPIDFVEKAKLRGCCLGNEKTWITNSKLMEIGTSKCSIVEDRSRSESCDVIKLKINNGASLYLTIGC